MEKPKSQTDRLAHASLSVENGWSRNVLVSNKAAPAVARFATTSTDGALPRRPIPKKLRSQVLRLYDEVRLGNHGNQGEDAKRGRRHITSEAPKEKEMV